MLPVAIGVAFNRVKELLVHGNFHLADTGTGVRVQEGLTDLRTTTIPLHRIQALELVQPLWWRRSGGGGSGSTSPARRVRSERGASARRRCCPVGTLEDARLVLSLAGARGADGRPGRRPSLGDGPDAGWRGGLGRARWLDPLSWRRNGWTDAPSRCCCARGG